ncbi:ATP-binding cassette domain-containing protein [Paenibacillus donghaensis]|uniref:UvrABC system protein A n=1 Tax=Paenibacillus donghaensis TaxID=414771 RepID=A0A2Z2KPT5_9BACL|nr:excinuclease ABC subunit UvrA [Paenibacillus donghaensis]ASA25770.1 ABC-ATPase UvrA [Paenibacillus donghaensis]
MSIIEIIRAHEGNLKDVSLEIPKNKLVVFTGLSGSGKSTLLLDVLFNECQRQYLEAITMQGIHKPKVERIRGASPAIAITQNDANSNPRSTVGTMTDIYTDLRMVYEKLGRRSCPHCGEMISAADCKEETAKIDNQFYVYMYCCNCAKRMDKVTRTHFSFNTREGACPACDGLGRFHSIHKERVVNEKLSLEGGAVSYWEGQYGTYQTSILYAACKHYGVPVPANIPVEQFSDMQKAMLYEGIETDAVRSHFPNHKPPRTTASGKFEGVLPIVWRRLSEKDGNAKKLEGFFDIVECPDCKGERLAEVSRSITVNGKRLPQLSLLSLEELCQWVKDLAASLTEQQSELVQAYLLDIQTKLTRIVNVGLGYLSVDRQIVTLSGGEMQRLRLAAILDSELSGVIYILDEPTAGLHPKDTAGLITILRKLRDLGNSVLVIEHDTDVMAASDYIVDIGPGSGKEGGEVVATGGLEEIMSQENSVTGNYLRSPQPGKTNFRKAAGAVYIKAADKFNLKNISVAIPVGCLTAVTGPSGSGKSTLIFEVLAQNEQNRNKNCVSGLEQFDNIIQIEQSPITKMKRSNVATYSEVYSEIRTVYAKTDAAKQEGLTVKHFSFNTPGGRCENCEGLGYIDSNMLFFSNTRVVCPVCNGKQFNNTVLAVKYKGLSIKDVLHLSVVEAVDFFADHSKLIRILQLLQDVGLGYLELGQTLTTLSGGEGQRLKLAKELIGSSRGTKNLYLMDEPTTGLHPQDIEHFLVLLNRIVDAGNSVVVVEHNQQVIRNSDWIIDLGPEGGARGGEIVFTGTPKEMMEITGGKREAYGFQ